jgi:RNA polymerase sigma-70 factor, ECF subfamily
MNKTAIEALVARSIAAWPSIGLAEDVFASHVARLVAGSDDPARTLANLHGPDLYLACASGWGNARAIALFQEEHLFELPWMVAQFWLEEGELDELAQLVRERLLVGPADRRPRLLDYEGWAPLRSWVRSVVTRTAFSLLRKAGRRRAGEPEDDALDLASAEDPEVDVICARHAGPFNEALQAAIDALSERDRTLLRLRFVDNESLEALCDLHAVHRATIARWIAKCRRLVREETQRGLGVSRSEMESLLLVLRNRIDVTL